MISWLMLAQAIVVAVLGAGGVGQGVGVELDHRAEPGAPVARPVHRLDARDVRLGDGARGVAPRGHRLLERGHGSLVELEGGRGAGRGLGAGGAGAEWLTCAGLVMPNSRSKRAWRMRQRQL